MNESVKTANKKYICLECKNENEVSGNVGDVVECAFCGIEYEIKAQDGEEYELQIIEEEK